MEEKESIQWVSLIVLVIGTFMAILDSSIVNVAVPKMMAVFGAGTDEIEWVLTGYMLTMGVIIPLTGYLGNRFGLKRMYIFSLAMFTIGSALCGFSWSVNSLVFARVIQALGGGMIMPISMTLVYRIIPREKIGVAMGLWGIAAMAAPAIGPTLSGYIVEYMDWRVIFTINIPIGIVAVVLAEALLDKFEGHEVPKFDFVGSFTVVIGLLTLLLGLNNGNSDGWTSPYILGLFTTAAISLAVFVINELSIKDPLLDLRILKNMSFSLSQLITTITTIAMFGGVFILPLYLQNLKGLTAMQSGMLMFPQAIITGLVMPISGKLYDKLGAKPLAVTGITLLTVTTFLLSRMTLNTSNSFIQEILILRGLGMGLAMMPIQNAGLVDIPTAKIGNASAVSSTIRQVAGSLGIAILSMVLTRRNNFHLASYANSVNMYSIEGKRLIGLLSGLGAKHGFTAAQTKVLGPLVIIQNLYKQAYMVSINDTLLVTFCICLFGVFLTFFIKKKTNAVKHTTEEELEEEILEASLSFE